MSTQPRDAALTTVLSGTFAFGNALDTYASSNVHNQNWMSAWEQHVTITDATPVNKTFADANVSVGANTIGITAHGYAHGLLVQLTTTGAVPTGLSADVNYYVVSFGANDFKLATTLANANLVPPTVIDITVAGGGGTHTVKATALAGLGINLAKSLDGTNYFNIASSTITGAGQTMTGSSGPVAYNYLKYVSTITAGQVTVTAKIRSVAF